jgi:uncharacterized protein YqeY
MLADKIEDDFKAALKAKDITKVETLRMLKASVNNFLIEKKKKVTEEAELLNLIQKQVKLREDAIEGFKKGGRQDLVDKESKEKAILQSYLPAQLSDQEVEALVKKAIQQTSARTKADLGRVMKEALSQTHGRSDARRVSEIAGKLLGSPTT